MLLFFVSLLAAVGALAVCVRSAWSLRDRDPFAHAGATVDWMRDLESWRKQDYMYQEYLEDTPYAGRGVANERHLQATR